MAKKWLAGVALGMICLERVELSCPRLIDFDVDIAEYFLSIAEMNGINGAYGMNLCCPGGVSIMNVPPKVEVPHLRIQHYILAFAVLWTVMIGGSLILDVQGHRREILMLAYSEGKAAYNKDTVASPGPEYT